jgi:hypothetical protein
MTTSSEAPRPAEPLPFRVILDEAMARVRRHWRAIYLPVAVPMAIGAGLIPLAQALLIQPGTMGRMPPGELLPRLLLFFVVIFAFVAVYVVAHTTLLAAVTDAVAGRELRLGRAFRFAAHPRTLLTLLLSWLAMMGGFLCCILPGIYAVLVFSILVPVMREEGVAWGAALKRTAELQGYNPHGNLSNNPKVQVFVILLVGALISYVVSFVAQFPFIAAQWVVMFRRVASGDRPDPEALMAGLLWLQVPAGIVGMLAQVAVQLYVCFGLVLHYFDVRNRKEGGDLEAAIAGLVPGAAPGSPAEPA